MAVYEQVEPELLRDFLTAIIETSAAGSTVRTEMREIARVRDRMADRVD